MTPTARSLAHLRQQGALVQVVEYWHHYSRRRRDLFGFIDIVAVDDAQLGVLGVQTTTGDHVAHRLEKCRTECADAMRRWLTAGNRLVIHGWAKQGPRGARKVWTLRERVVTVADLDGEDRQAGAY